MDNDEIIEQSSSVFKTLRSRVWTVAQVAGMSRNHYQLLESGISNRQTKRPANPRLSTLIALSAVFGISVPELIGTVFT